MLNWTLYLSGASGRTISGVGKRRGARGAPVDNAVDFASGDGLGGSVFVSRGANERVFGWGSLRTVDEIAGIG